MPSDGDRSSPRKINVPRIVIAIAVAIGTAIIAIATFSDALDTLIDQLARLLRTPEALISVREEDKRDRDICNKTIQHT